MDDNYPPEEPPDEVVEKMREEKSREEASAHAQDDAEYEGLDWNSLDSEEQERRIEEAAEAIAGRQERLSQEGW